jgi:nicotinamidase-related amidase
MKALFVIDVQKATIGKTHDKFFKYDEELINRINKSIEENETVIYIRNLMKNNFINKLAPVHVFDGTVEAELSDEVIKKGNVIFDKYKGDAFTNPKLLDYLKENNVDTIEIVGVDGGGCISLTALGAIDNGFKVILNTNAIGTMFNKKKEKYYKLLKEKGAEFK